MGSSPAFAADCFSRCADKLAGGKTFINRRSKYLPMGLPVDFGCKQDMLLFRVRCAGFGYLPHLSKLRLQRLRYNPNSIEHFCFCFH
jgi:hypothetical protein